MGVIEELKDLAAAHGFGVYVTRHHDMIRLEARPVAGGRLSHPLVGYGDTETTAAGKLLAELQALPVR